MFIGARSNGFETLLFGVFMVGLTMITIIAVAHFNHVELIDSIRRLIESMQTTEPPSN